jgi:G3E family GTPase
MDWLSSFVSKVLDAVKDKLSPDEIKVLENVLRKKEREVRIANSAFLALMKMAAVERGTFDNERWNELVKRSSEIFEKAAENMHNNRGAFEGLETEVTEFFKELGLPKESADRFMKEMDLLLASDFNHRVKKIKVKAEEKAVEKIKLT